MLWQPFCALSTRGKRVLLRSLSTNFLSSFPSSFPSSFSSSSFSSSSFSSSSFSSFSSSSSSRPQSPRSYLPEGLQTPLLVEVNRLLPNSTDPHIVQLLQHYRAAAVLPFTWFHGADSPSCSPSAISPYSPSLASAAAFAWSCPPRGPFTPPLPHVLLQYRHLEKEVPSANTAPARTQARTALPHWDLCGGKISQSDRYQPIVTALREFNEESNYAFAPLLEMQYAMLTDPLNPTLACWIPLSKFLLIPLPMPPLPEAQFAAYMCPMSLCPSLETPRDRVLRWHPAHALLVPRTRKRTAADAAAAAAGDDAADAGGHDPHSASSGPSPAAERPPVLQLRRFVASMMALPLVRQMITDQTTSSWAQAIHERYPPAAEPMRALTAASPPRTAEQFGENLRSYAHVLASFQ